MKKYFIVSLCKNGILGGGITVSDEAITYHTEKLTIQDQYKHIEMRYRDICSLKVGRLFIFPTVTLQMRSGPEYKFVVFAKKQFLHTLEEMGVDLERSQA